jgi:Flp pilus assembly protein TadG
MALEAALFIPVLVLLIVGMVQFGKITYQYYVIKKIVYSAARQISASPGVNFCDLTADPVAQAAIAFALNDGTGTPLIPDLTADRLQITAACSAAVDAPPAPCDQPACPTVAQRPDYVVVTIPAGYQVRPRILYVDLPPIDLRPSAMVPFGGVS